MADRRPKLLFDALGAITAARSFIANLSFEAYAANLLVRSAVERRYRPASHAGRPVARMGSHEITSVPRKIANSAGSTDAAT